MTSTSRPNNATPQRLLLKPPGFPRMPFSSPMGEEIQSPTTPNTSRTPPQKQQTPPQPLINLENPGSEERHFALDKPSRGEWGRKKDDGPHKSKWPPLNIVTNLSKPPRSAPRRERNQDTSNLSHLPDNPRARSHQNSNTELKSSGSKGRLDDLKRAPSKISNLSPSDRAVVIGISIPSEDIGQHTISPDNSMNRSLEDDRCAQERSSSVTPTILVTPAKEESPWRRAASSMYSQAPFSNHDGIDSSVVPPIPSLPSHARRQSVDATPSEKKGNSDVRVRALSSCTVFEEDDSPGMGDPRTRLSEDSQPRRLRRPASNDSVATRHRSQGWWNQIISPFFPRSPMTFKFSPDRSEVPPLPSALEQTSPLNRDRKASIFEKEVSPLVPKSEGLGSSHTSWTDSSLEAECEKLALDFSHSLGSNKSASEQTREIPKQENSSVPCGLEGFGAAAEYFEACLYEMHSPEPYFECQNHVCSYGRVGPSMDADLQNGITKGWETPTGVPEGRSLGTVQAPSNRFSAAFTGALGIRPKGRPQSDATVIEDLDGTPAIEEARAAPILRIREPVRTPRQGHCDERAIADDKGEDSKPLPTNPPSPEKNASPEKGKPARKFVAVMPPHSSRRALDEPFSPEKSSPVQTSDRLKDAVPLKGLPRDGGASRNTQSTNTKDTTQERSSQRKSRQTTTLFDLYPPFREPARKEEIWEVKTKQLPPHKTNKRKSRNCFSRDKAMAQKNKWLLIAIAAALICMIILILILCLTLTRKGDKLPVQSQWLNITGYPPMPIGISTIAQPDAAKEVSGCVQPETMWSCALPKMQQQDISPNAPDQPNFRVEIRFQNGTNATASNGTSSVKRSAKIHVVSARRLFHRSILQVRSAFDSALFTPSPSPPSREEQAFLGNTTDDNHEPMDGEFTPFFMSFHSPTKLASSRLVQRQSKRATNTTDPFPDLSKEIPAPETNPDGTAASANLLPLPSAQPLRLYDRGLPTEHLGFYIYYDRSIFLKSTSPINGSDNGDGAVPDDKNGGADEAAASVRCTWAQTRFLVQIWTSKGGSAPLLPGNGTSPSSPRVAENSTSLSNSSANNFDRPGSFPYPITVTLDRHGGDVKTKAVYCYGLDEREKPVSSEKKLQVEDRAFGGKLVNASGGPFNEVNVTLAQGGPGGIDGGSGGCSCKWQNWR